MTSPVEVCRTALMALGVSDLITRLSGSQLTTPERLCAEAYPNAVAEVFEAHDWPFARRFQALATVDDHTPPAPWTFAFSRPAGALRMIQLETAREIVPPEQRLPWAEWSTPDGSASLLYSNEQAPVAFYVAIVDDVGRWPPSFADAVAMSVAKRIAPALAGPKAKAINGLELAARALATARMRCGISGDPQARPKARAHRARAW